MIIDIPPSGGLLGFVVRLQRSVEGAAGYAVCRPLISSSEHEI